MPPTLQPINKIYEWLAAASTILFIVLAVWTADWSVFKFAAVPPASAPNLVGELNRPIDPFENLTLEAQAALVFYPDEQKAVFAKNADHPLPIASLTKIMTTLAATRVLPPEATVQFMDRPWRLANLTDYLLVSSSNAAAAALAAAAENNDQQDQLVAEMNAQAAALGLTTTHFNNPTGLDLADGEPGGVGSATDIAKLLVYILKYRPEMLAATRYREIELVSLDGSSYHLTNTNEIISEIPGLLASKTGYTAAARGNLAVIFDRGLNQPVVIVVLGSSVAGRFQDIKKLISATYDY
ncbi:MAG TPA: hypothetical protein VJL36_00505 [Candidatus Paceibacterota bacterium]